jgi:UDP-N-acetylmuramoyl-tripeptide--D-alanyl-D-alanine ligase
LGQASGAAAKSFGQGAFAYDNVEALVSRADSLMGPDVSVLVKGSRFMKMERIVEKMEEKDQACC